MTCQDSIELMQRYLDQDVNEKEEQELQLHLQQCTECAGLFERLRLLDSELAQLPKVTPAISLVDAILPQLAELDRQSAALEETAAREPVATAFVPRGSIPRARRSFVSWKWFSGAAVAAAIIGVFVIKDQNLVLAPSLGKKDMAAAAGSASSASTARTFAADNASPANGAKPDAKFAEPKQTSGASASNAGGSEAKGANSSGAEQSQPAATPQPGTEQHATGSAASKDQAKQSDPKAPKSDINDRVMVSSPSAGTNAGEAGTLAPHSAQPEANAPMGITSAPADGTPSAETPVTRMAPRNSPNGAPSLAAPVTESKSIDGKFLAVVEKNKVFVRSASTGTTVYSSVYGWADSDIVSLVGWSDSAMLIYSVQHSDGADTVTIDLAAKTETKKSAAEAE